MTDLRHFFYKKVGFKPMEELTRLLNSKVAPSRDLPDVIWVFVFTHGATYSDQVVLRDSTHAVSAFSRTADGMAHRYFERVGENFREIPKLAVTVKAMPDLDDIRLLHFAAFELGELPAQSTFYEFKAEYWGVENVLHLSDSTLRTAILLDAQKLAGAPTTGLNGHEVYAALLRRQQNGDDSNCGNASPFRAPLPRPHDERPPTQAAPAPTDGSSISPRARASSCPNIATSRFRTS